MKLIKANCIAFVLLPCFFFLPRINLALLPCTRGWHGEILINGETLENWSVESDPSGSTGSRELVSGLIGQAVQLNWNIGPGNWVQAKYTFSDPVDLSTADIFGFSLRGGGPGEIANTVAVMFADTNDVFYEFDMTGPLEPHGSIRGINQIDRWLINISLPKKEIHFLFWSFSPNRLVPDYSFLHRREKDML